MEGDLFWDYVQNSVNKVYTDDEELLELVMITSDQAIRNSAIRKRLLALDFQTAKAFQTAVSQRIYALYLPNIVELFLVTASTQLILGKPQYFSRDGFVDFRAQIVSLGKEKYEQFLKLESEDSIIDFDMSGNHFHNEEFAYIGLEVASILDGSKSVDYCFDGDIEVLQRDIDWEHLDAKYPKLWEKYQVEED